MDLTVKEKIDEVKTGFIQQPEMAKDGGKRLSDRCVHIFHGKWRGQQEQLTLAVQNNRRPDRSKKYHIS